MPFEECSFLIAKKEENKFFEWSYNVESGCMKHEKPYTYYYFVRVEQEQDKNNKKKLKIYR